MAVTVADKSSRPIVHCVIEGLGPDTDAAGTAVQYRFSNVDPGFAGAVAGSWRPYLASLPDHLETTLDVVTGEVGVGSLTVDLVEGAHPTVFLSELLATRERSRVGRLLANATAGAATVDVATVAGAIPAINDVISIGTERLRVTGVTVIAGGHRLNVTRARYGTTAIAHSTDAERGDGEVRYRAHFLRGRQVDLYLNFQGNVEGDQILLGRFLINRLEFVGGSRWRIHTTGIERRLSADIAMHAFSGHASNWFARRDRFQLDRDDFGGQPIPLALFASGDASAGLPDSDDPFAPQPDSANGGHLRYGDACIEYDLAAGEARNVGALRVTVTGWEVARTGLPSSDDPIIRVREVWPTDPRLPHMRFKPTPHGGSAEASDHPIDIFLCLALSTGAGTNVGATDVNYDVLPRGIGAGIPHTLFDIGEWEAMKWRTLGARMPNLIIGWDGPDSLQRLAEEQLLGPLGIAAVQDEVGLIAPVRISEIFPADTSTTLDDDDIIAATESYDWGLDGQILGQVWKIDHEGPDGDPYEIRVLSPEARVRYPGVQNRTAVFEARGLTRRSGGEAIIHERAAFLFRHFLEPPPTVTLKLNWNRLFLPLGEPVLVTYAPLPNPATGTRGLTAAPFVVVRRRLALADLLSGRGGGGGVEVELFWVGLDSPTLVHIGPSAVVTGWDAGTLQASVTRNAFTDGTAWGSVVADDTDGFTVGGVGVGDLCCHIDQDGALRSANVVRVTAKTATKVTLHAAPATAPVAGDILIYCGDTGAPSYPASAWTSHMQEHGAYADATNTTIGTTARVNHWGD